MDIPLVPLFKAVSKIKQKVEQMTNQEMFDKIVTHARKQRCKAFLPSGPNDTTFMINISGCAYRADLTPECPTRCFLGALIPDELYSKDIEGYGLPDNILSRSSSGKLPDIMDAIGVKVESYPFLIELQTVHDTVDIEEWESKFAALAYKYYLTYTN